MVAELLLKTLEVRQTERFLAALSPDMAVRRSIRELKPAAKLAVAFMNIEFTFRVDFPLCD
jgi:hypothetical protein